MSKSILKAIGSQQVIKKTKQAHIDQQEARMLGCMKVWLPTLTPNYPWVLSLKKSNSDDSATDWDEEYITTPLP